MNKAHKDQIFYFDFQNKQPQVFSDVSLSAKEILERTGDLTFVVMMNHMDQGFFISRTKKPRPYMCEVANFMNGMTRYSGTIRLQSARTERNLPYWSTEFIPAIATSVGKIREKLDGWKELGSLTHISRLGIGSAEIYKITHVHSGWSRYASHQTGRAIHGNIIGSQSSHALILNSRKDKSFTVHEKLVLENEYRKIRYDFENDPTSFTVEVVNKIDQLNSNERPTDIVREINIANHAAWMNSPFIKNLLGEKK